MQGTLFCSSVYLDVLRKLHTNGKVTQLTPISVTVSYKVFVCRRSIAGIAGLNTAEGTEVRLVLVMCCVANGLCDGLTTHSEEESYRMCFSV